ncbi:MAG: ABC transporter ATP-binding protein [Oscillochloridaceae bacterium umkhey_bin13]
MNRVIEIRELHKAYSDLQVLRGFNLTVGAGEVYGLLGPNGAGKSTLIHLLLGFLRPDQGQIRLFGNPNLEQMRLQVGYIPERQRYHTRTTPREYLRFLGQLSGMSGTRLEDRIDDELQAVGLSDAADRSLGPFSKGMLQRFGVAQALLSDPDLLLIDEPTSGLDPAGQREVLELLSDVRRRGHTILLCTHYLYEVELLCDRVGVLTGGRLVTEAVVGDLRGSATSIRIQATGMDTSLRLRVEALGPGIRCDGQQVRVTQNTPELQAAVLRTILDGGGLVTALEPLESPLERLYLEAVESTNRPASMPVYAGAPPPWEVSEPTEPATLTYRRTDGDTLLNELLGRERVAQSDEPSSPPESSRHNDQGD